MALFAFAAPLSAQYFGDTALAGTHDFKFTTRTTTGAPTTLAGSPVVKCYIDNSTSTEVTTGVTLTVDFDGITGLNNLRVDMSNAFYATASNLACIITTGTVGGTSVVGEVVAQWSINDRSALRPATAGRTLVVDTSGLADANTVKVGPTGSGTAQTAADIPARIGAFTGTGVNTVLGFFKALAKSDASNPSDLGGTFDAATDSLQAQQDASISLTTQAGTNLNTFFDNGSSSSTSTAGNVTSIKAKTDLIPAAPASTSNITGGTITTVTNLTNAPTAGDLTSTMKTSVTTATAGNKAVPASTAFEWGLGPFRSSLGVTVTTGTPSCTRSIDSVSAFAATTNSPHAVTANGLTELTISATDTAGTYYVFLKCSLAGAVDYFQEFKLQP